MLNAEREKFAKLIVSNVPKLYDHQITLQYHCIVGIQLLGN